MRVKENFKTKIRKHYKTGLLLLMAGKCSDEWKEALAHFEVVDVGYIREQQKMNEFYAMADLMVNPSTYETFGLVNIEAMASGTPVAAFHICVMSEVVSSKVGWLCEEISADAFRTLIQQVERDRGGWKQKAEKCHTYVQDKYDEKKMTKGSGVTLILFGIVTFIDSYTTSLTAKIIYILAILAILVGFVVYLKKKCIKK